MVQMKSRFSRLMNQNKRFFLLDLREAYHADLAGIGILIDRIKKVRALHGDIRLFNLRPEVAQILHLIGLNQVIATYATEEEARKSYSAIPPEIRRMRPLAQKIGGSAAFFSGGGQAA
jgi:anti-anti-sigma factor